MTPTSHTAVAEFPRGNSEREGALDAAVRVLRDHEAEAEGGLWKIAAVLRRIFDERLWEHRTAPEGGARYRSFKEFVQAETKLGYTHAIRLAHLAELGPVAFARHGLRKLYAVSSAPEHVQAELLEACELGEPAKEIERRARAARAPETAASGAAPRRKARPMPPWRTVVYATCTGESRYQASVKLVNGLALSITFEMPDAISDDAWVTVDLADEVVR